MRMPRLTARPPASGRVSSHLRSPRLFAVLAVLGLVGAGLMQFRIETSTEAFLPDSDPAMASLEAKTRSFGGDPIVVLLESDDEQSLTIESNQLTRLLRLEGELARLPDVAVVYGPATLLNQTATSAQALLARISGMRDAIRSRAQDQAKAAGLTPPKAKKLADRAVAEFELRYGSLLAAGLPAGLPTLHNADFVRTILFDGAGQPRARWRFVVPNTRSVAVLVRPREGLEETQNQRLVDAVRAQVEDAGLDTARITVTGVPVVSAGLARQVSDELVLLSLLIALVMLARFLLVPSAVRGLARLAPLGAALLGSAMTVALMGWLDISISLGGVALLPMMLGIGSSFPLYLWNMSDRRTAVTVALAAAAGFATLALSPLPFVQQIGMMLAIGVIFTVAVALWFHPGQSAPAATAPRRTQRGRLRWSVPVGATALLAAMLVAAGGWVGLSKIGIEADPRALASGVEQISDAQYAEKVLGTSGEISVVLESPDVLSTESLRWAKETEDLVIQQFGGQVRPIMSMPRLLSFLGPDATPEQITAAMMLLPGYLTNAVVRPDGQQALLIYGVKLQDLAAQGEFLDDLRTALPAPPPGARVEVVGLPVAADRGYSLLSADRYPANLLGIVAAGIVLAIGLRLRRDAAYAVLAALISTGWVLAGLEVLGRSLSPLTLALGSLTTVTACEFTVLSAYAVRRGDISLSRIVIWAGASSGLGYLALVPSRLWLLRDFGLVLCATVLLSYVAARIVVAATTSGPSDALGTVEASAAAVPSREEAPA